MKVKEEKVIKIVISCFLSLVAVCGLAMAFVLNYNSLVPDKVEIMQNDDQVFLFVTPNTNYEGYRFILSDIEEKHIIDCENNILTLDECLEQGVELGKSYKVKFCYLGKSVGNNSQFSKEVTWNAVVQLKAPCIEYSQANNLISWNNVDGADFYMVYYNNGNGLETRKIDKNPNGNQFSLSSVPVGDRSFYVVACSNIDYIKPSKASNIIERKVTREMQEFEEINFDRESKILTLKSVEDLTQILVYIGETKYKCEFNKVETGGAFIYTKDISFIYEEDAKIGVKPVDIDEFTFYSGEICYAE